MKNYDKIKTVQLVIYLALTIAAVIFIFNSDELFHIIADNRQVAIFFLLFWGVLATTFIFMFVDFSSYSTLKREYSELDLAIFSDPVTGMANRNSCDAFIEQYLDKPLPKDIGCITIDITNLKDINSRYGHLAGNNAIKEFSAVLQASAKGICFVGRNGGNKFLAIFQDCSDEKIEKFLSKVNGKLATVNEKRNKGEIIFSYGVAFQEEGIETINELISLSNRKSIESYRTFVDR